AFLDPAANGSDLAAGEFSTVAEEPMSIRDASPAETSDSNFDLQHVFESRGGRKIAFAADARPAYRAGGVAHHNAQAHAPQQVVLGLLHHPEERREVHDPCGVGVAELHAPTRQKRSTHE